MSRTSQELRTILDRFREQALHGSGFHYELFARRYSTTLEHFRGRLTDPLERDRYDALLTNDGDYFRTDITDAERLEIQLQKDFDTAPKNVAADTAARAKGWVPLLDVPPNAALVLPDNVTEIGSVRVGTNATLVAPGVTNVTYNVIAQTNARLVLPLVERIGTLLPHTTTERGDGHYDPDFNARSLDGMDLGRIELNQARLDAPNLRRVDADLIIQGGTAALPTLEKLHGGLLVQGSEGNPASLDLPRLRHLGTTVTYPVHEELDTTLCSSVRLQHCHVQTPALETIVSSAALHAPDSWSYPLTYEIARHMSRLGDLSVAELRAEILKDAEPSHRYNTLYELAGDATLSSSLKRDLLLSLPPDLRMYGYLQTDARGLTDQDVRAVLASLPADNLRHTELSLASLDEFGRPDTDYIRPATAIRDKLAAEQRLHLAPAALSDAAAHGDRATLQRIIYWIENPLGATLPGGRITHENQYDAIEVIARQIKNLSPSLATVASKVASAHSGYPSPYFAAGVLRFWSAVASAASELPSVAALELRFSHPEAIASHLPSISQERARQAERLATEALRPAAERIADRAAGVRQGVRITL